MWASLDRQNGFRAPSPANGWLVLLADHRCVALKNLTLSRCRTFMKDVSCISRSKLTCNERASENCKAWKSPMTDRLVPNQVKAKRYTGN